MNVLALNEMKILSRFKTFTYDPAGVVLTEIKADEMGETLDEDLFDSLCASRNIRR